MKIGATDIVNCKIGSTQVNEIRIGSTLVWQFSSVDPDAQAFITAAGITNPTQQTAINTLVVSLKANGIWSKMKALYPFVGGTASTHKFNLKDPRDLDIAFRLIFNGGVTHSTNGVQFGGVNGFGNTFITPSTSLNLNSTHISYYSRTSGATGYIFGTNDVAVANRTLWQLFGGTNYMSVFTATGNFFSYGGANSLSMLMVNRTASNLSNAWAAGVKKATSTNPSSALTTLPLYIGANNTQGVAGFFCNAQCAFSSIGDGLTDTDASNLYTNVQAFQTALSRQV